MFSRDGSTFKELTKIVLAKQFFLDQFTKSLTQVRKLFRKKMFS